EGLPLGIELAAGNLRAMTCRQIARHLQSKIDVLASSLRNVAERHRSLRAVFEQTWAMLTPPERQVLMKLAIFRRAFEQEAAGEVAGASLPVVNALVEKSLLRMDGRYDLHEMLRQFAYEKLVESGLEEQVRCSHRDYFCKLTDEGRPRLLLSDVTWL